MTNSWHATEDKRDAMRQDDPQAANSYMPGLQISTKLIGDEIEIRFKDNGTGMPADVVERIFNPFFTTKATNRGTGLGLSLSNDIVRSHGGNIRVETEPGEFTEFIITLPTSNPAALEATSAAPRRELAFLAQIQSLNFRHLTTLGSAVIRNRQSKHEMNAFGCGAIKRFVFLEFWHNIIHPCHDHGTSH